MFQRTILLYLQLEGIMERYVKMVEKHLKVLSTHLGDWDKRLPNFC
jgi:hypothetical protein